MGKMADSGAKLLTRYAKNGDEPAFREFSKLYLGLIFHVALRRTGHRQLAEEACQNVLFAVAKKAAGLAKKPDQIAPWLHRATLFEASKIMRSEKSHKRRNALSLSEELLDQGSEEGPLEEAFPYLDLALDGLSSSDREVVLLHYYGGETFKAIGSKLNKPSATVQKQCRRALDKLGRILRGKGVVLSGTVLAAGLSSQFAKAAPASLGTKVAGSALAGGGYSVTPLNLYLASKSKLALTLACSVLLVPLVARQFKVQEGVSENARLRTEIQELQALGSMRSSPGENRSRVIVNSESRITIEALRIAYEVGQREGGLQSYEFEELVDALPVEDLVRLIPQALTLPGSKRTQRQLAEELVARLIRHNPKEAVILTWGLDPENPIRSDLGGDEAVYFWTQEEPAEAVEWLKERVSKVRQLAEGNYSFWSGYRDYVGAALCALIESGSDLTREVISIAPELLVVNLMQDAVRRPGRAAFHRIYGDEEVLEESEVERIITFLPWIRELVPVERNGVGVSQRSLLERLVSESEIHDERESAFFELLLRQEELLAEERSWLVQLRTEDLLEEYFNGRDGGREWKEIESGAREWLESYAEEGGGVWFAEIREEVLEKRRYSLEHQIESLEKQEAIRDADLKRRLLDVEYRLFPEFRERALQQAKRIKDVKQRQEVIDFIKK